MPESTALYRLYDRDSTLLYVGISNDPVARFRAHHRKPWAKEIARADVEHHDTREAALEAEREAIRSEHPRHNIIHVDRTYYPTVDPARIRAQVAASRRAQGLPPTITGPVLDELAAAVLAGGDHDAGP